MENTNVYSPYEPNVNEFKYPHDVCMIMHNLDHNTLQDSPYGLMGYIKNGEFYDSLNDNRIKKEDIVKWVDIENLY